MMEQDGTFSSKLPEISKPQACLLASSKKSDSFCTATHLNTFATQNSEESA